MSEFLHMGGFAVYVWTAYGVAALVLIGLTIWTLAALKSSAEELQALEAIKLIVGVGESLAGYLVTFDAKYHDWRKLKLPKNPDCMCAK